MDTVQEQVYIGIDLNEEWTQISYYRPGMKEPETVSTVLGEEQYRIPTEGFTVAFLRKVIRYVPNLLNFSQIQALTFHLNQIKMETVELLHKLTKQMGIDRERVFIQDHKESFCHFAMNQEKSLMQHDVFLFLCEEDELSCFWLEKNNRTVPKQIEIKSLVLGELPKERQERDSAFARMAENAMKGKIVSSVYLMGQGLEGGWIQESLQILCRGRRAFQGKNLYSKGACYGSVMQKNKEKCGYVYFSEYKLSQNVFLQVRNGERTFFKELAEAGSSCYEVQGSCQILLEGESCVDIWLQAPDSKKARIESLELTDLPKRPPKATRLLVEAVPGEKKQICIRITDMGFGQWYAPSGKVWEYCIDE